jgi:UDP-N-acetylmuramoyl-tripeptide--D-alanyl-D-alanine ligase
MTIDRADAVGATQAMVLERDRLPARLRFSTDTRSIVPGDAFIALRGAKFDGHAFVGEALARGAALLVVSDERAVPRGTPALVVPDTTVAYLTFAGVARNALRARVAAITGSAGKTTTKAFLAQILERATDAPVVATHANENNEIGVAKLLLSASADAAYVVVEFGARHYGEIVPLARAARPDVAILTNVGEAHLEIMGSPERLAETKWGIFASGAHAVLNADDAVSCARAPGLANGITWFGNDPRDAALRHAERFVSLSRVRDLVPRDELRVRDADGAVRTYPTDIAVAGEHNRSNVLAASAGALALGIAPDRIAHALPELVLPSGRYERIDAGGIAVIYDAYNASMSGTLATLASFAREPARQRVAVLGSMAELGSEAPAMHERVGAAAANSNLDALLVGGDFAPDLSRGARDGGFDRERIVPFATNAVAVAWLRANVGAGGLVLLKGSRRYRLEEIVDGLRG